jgi:hypothetical protein
MTHAEQLEIHLLGFFTDHVHKFGGKFYQTNGNYMPEVPFEYDNYISKYMDLGYLERIGNSNKFTLTEAGREYYQIQNEIKKKQWREQNRKKKGIKKENFRK